MITTNIANKYDKIFRKATNILRTRFGDDTMKQLNPYWVVGEGEENGIMNLDAYFMSFETLLETLNENEMGPFVLLPLDEEPFEINANTREIKVPTAFKKGVAVQGDCGSEILVFTIDRYFDYMDLNNMDIYIQYTTPDKKESAYKVDLFDRESMPGKIRFGWILGPDVTETNGNLKFSVRFFKQSIETPGLIDYSFNTLTQTVNIYSALQPKVNVTTDDYNNKLFKKVVKNSLEAGAIPAETPSFGTEPPSNLPEKASLDAHDTLTLKVKATVTDGKNVEYTWYYASDRDNPLGEYVKIEEDAHGNTYTIDSTDEGSTCTINPTEEGTSTIVTGFYRVTAINRLSPTNVSNPVSSIACELPSPKILEVTDNLDYAEDSEIIGNPISITVKVDPFAVASCTWKKIKDDTITTIGEVMTGSPDEKGEVVFTITPEEEGYYFAEVTSLLNRTTVELKEEDKTNMVTTNELGFEAVVDELPAPADRKNVVRVTNLPAAPTVAGDAPEGQTSLAPDANGLYTVKSYINQIEIGDFTSDKQDYVWKYSVTDPGKDDKVISTLARDFVDGPIDESTIKIKHNHLPSGAIIIWCESYNTLNGERTKEPVKGPEFILGFNTRE